MKILEIVVLVLFVVSLKAQVIGIDLGTEYWKAALISPGKNLAIVQNSRSNRKSINGIAFQDGIRFFQDDALSKRLKKLKSSYFYLNKLLASLDVAPIPGYHFENGTYFFQEQDSLISLQQMVAMILKNIKKYSSKQAGTKIKECVMSVPAHWGFKAKMSLVNAAHIAQLSVLGLLNENAAAAIHFAISRNDTTPINIGFFNLGSHLMQFSIIRFSGYQDQQTNKTIESMSILSHVVLQNVGGLRIDEELAKTVIDKFKNKHHIDITTNQKAMTKLLHKCSDVKETLSANKEATIYIQALIEGIDLNMEISRDIIETLPIFDPIREKIREALNIAGISIGDLHSVEIIGGASRIPSVTKCVKELFEPVEVGAHINGDQAVAFGSALRAANLSIAFRVKQLHFYDGLPLDSKVVVSSNEDGVLLQQTLFTKDSEHGLKKEISLVQITEDLKVSIYYGEQMIHEYNLVNVSSWKEVHNQSKLNFTEKPKTVLAFVCHSITIAELKEAYINITVNTTSVKSKIEYYEEEDSSTVNATAFSDISEDEPVKVAEKNETGQSSEPFQSAETQKKPETEKTIEAQQTPQTEKTPQAEKTPEVKEQNETGESLQTNNSQGEKNTEKVDNNGKDSAEQTQEKKEKKKRPKKAKKRKVTISRTVDVESFKIENKRSLIKVEQVYCQYKKYSKDEIEEQQGIIIKYQNEQNEIKQKAKLRNDFESTLYRLKDDYDNPALIQFSTEEQISKLKVKVVEQLQWLEQNAWTAKKAQFKQHFDSLYTFYEPMVNRSLEARDRQKTFNQCMSSLAATYEKMTGLRTTHDWMGEMIEVQLKRINDTVQQIHTQVMKQLKQPLNANPIFYNHMMLEKAEDMRQNYYLIKMIPRPKMNREQPVEDKPNEEKQPDTKEQMNLDEDTDIETEPKEKSEPTTESQEQPTVLPEDL